MNYRSPFKILILWIRFVKNVDLFFFSIKLIFETAIFKHLCFSHKVYFQKHFFLVKSYKINSENLRK